MPADDIRQLVRRLDDIADAPIAAIVAQRCADRWEIVALDRMGKDTHQLERRTGIVAFRYTGTRATIDLEADTPYAGYHNYGTSVQAPNGFWNLGLEAAEAAGREMGTVIGASIERSLRSGGVWNPRRDLVR